MKTLKISDVAFEMLKELAKKNRQKPDAFNEQLIELQYKNSK